MGPDAAAWACGNKNKTGNGKKQLRNKICCKNSYTSQNLNFVFKNNLNS
jgi:hypothetical protein